MRAAWLAGFAVCLATGLSGCGDKSADKANAPPPGVTPDQAAIDGAQKISDVIGGCQRPTDASHQSRVVTLEKNRVVMLACSQADMFYTDRLFLAGPKDMQLLTLPDYEAAGWFATDQASMAELDAGTGVLTTQRMTGGKQACGSEGRYQFTGGRFELQEMRWQACGDKNVKEPPFPVIWPAPVVPGADLSNSAPAP